MSAKRSEAKSEIEAILSTMKEVPPPTAELDTQVHVLVEMLESTFAVLHDYIETHPGRQHHLGEEAALLCRNLLKHLRHLIDHDEKLRGLECTAIVANFHRDADTLESMACQVHRQHGDDRLMQALNILAESFRFLSAAVLRWYHGCSNHAPDISIEKRRQRFLRVLKPLARELAAA